MTILERYSKHHQFNKTKSLTLQAMKKEELRFTSGKSTWAPPNSIKNLTTSKWPFFIFKKIESQYIKLKNTIFKNNSYYFGSHMQRICVTIKATIVKLWQQFEKKLNWVKVFEKIRYISSLTFFFKGSILALFWIKYLTISKWPFWKKRKKKSDKIKKNSTSNVYLRSKVKRSFVFGTVSQLIEIDAIFNKKFDNVQMTILISIQKD